MKNVIRLFVKMMLAGILISCGQSMHKENSPLSGQLAGGSAINAGMSEQRLMKIDGLILDYLHEGKIPGAVALVARKGSVVYEKSFGFRDIAAGDTLKSDDIFRIASMTKAITSTAVMMLYEDGKFLLDDPVSNYIPSFKNPRIMVRSNPDGSYTDRPARGEVTIRQLLTHTSGIGYGFNDPELKPIYDKANIPDGFVTTQATLAGAMEAMGRMPLLFEPGEKFHYGLNTDVLGYLVEVVSGKSLDQFFRERIFNPLGMSDTHFFLPEDKINRLATIYAETEEGIKPSTESLYQYPVEGPKKYFSGGAGLCSTAMDYARFLQLFISKGKCNGQQLLSPKTIELMQRNQVGDMFGVNDFGLGFGLVTPEGAANILGSAGNMWWGGYFHTHFWVDPEEELVGILMLQMSPVIHGEIADKFQVLVYQSIVE